MLARVYGLELGGAGRSTLGRLEAAARAGTLPERIFAGVAEAYRFLVALRLRLQLDELSRGKPPSSALALADLSGVERGHLKEALRAVKALQDAGALHFRTEYP
jgi:CBS domain-containing protein